MAVIDAFRIESRRLSQAVSGEDAASFARPSPCPPWTVGELLYHVRMAVGRLPGMLAAPDPGGARLVPAAAYYRPDQRFSAATNAARVESAQHGAAALATAAALARDFDQVRREACALLEEAPPALVVLTRHGDRMLLTEFLRTRVLELAVHGLDLAAGLERRPWMSPQAATVIEDLMLPSGAAADLRTELGWDQIALVARITGRHPLTAAETQLIERRGIQWLALS